MRRRQFIQDMAVLGVVARGASRAAHAADDEPTARRLPRWRGFNLQGRFGWPGRPYEGPAYEEADFEMMAEWGFEFARLPLAYWAWGSRDDWSLVREEPLAWMGDYLALWKEAGWGWALWNLRGDFGILDSNRADVRYEDYKGHKLDRKMLELLRSS